MANKKKRAETAREDHLGAGCPRRSGRHFRTVQARGHRDRTADQRRARNLKNFTVPNSRLRRPRQRSSWSGWIQHHHDPAVPRGWQIGGILCCSKICTHVGCPISLREQQTHHLLCPCHQSTFDLGDAGVVVFGPADRPLPQLPITDAEGYIVAQRDFLVPPGPSYFERDSRHDSP